MEVRFHEGMRVSDPETVEVAKMVLLGKVNSDIVGRLNRHGQPAVGLSGDDGALFEIRPHAKTDGRRVRRRDRARRRRRPQPHRRGLHPGDRVGRRRPRGQRLQRQRRHRRRQGRGRDRRLQGDLPHRRRRLARRPGRSRAASSRARPWARSRRRSAASRAGCAPSSRPAPRRSTAGSRSAHIVDGRRPHSLLLELFTRGRHRHDGHARDRPRRSSSASRGATRCRPTPARRWSSSAARARGSGTPRAGSTSTSSPGSRSTTPATATRRSSRRSASRRRSFAGSSNLFYSEPALRLCERLVEASLGGEAFLCNSGAEANECALKLARKRAHARGIERPEVVVLDSAFHGRTLGALAATPRLAREDLFGPLPQGFVAVAARRRRRAARRGRRGNGGGPDRADPGRGRGLPDRRRGPRGRARGLRRHRRGADLRRGPDRDGAHRVAVGLRAARGPPRRDHDGQGARRRACRSAPA